MTNRTLAAPLLSLAAALAIAGCAQRTDPGKIAEQARKDALGLVAAYNAQDAHAAAAIDAPDYVGIYHGAQNTVGPVADEAGMKAQMAAAKLDWQMGEGKVTVAKAGDIAIFEAPYTFAVSYKQGGGMRERGTWIAIFKRQDDGSMKLWRSIASDGPAATPGAR
jgi:ketosteroid isomerase-like protein